MDFGPYIKYVIKHIIESNYHFIPLLFTTNIKTEQIIHAL